MTKTLHIFKSSMFYN